MIDVKALTDEGLQTLIKNHQKKAATDAPLYGLAVNEMNRRHGAGLKLETTIAFIRAAAARREFVSYRALAEANGATWEKVRFPMNTDLLAVVDHAHRQGWPMLSAIVVNKDNLATGAMEPSTITGFAAAARELGYVVTDEAQFLRGQQDACFVWASGQGGIA